ncbi:MAG: prolyl aminopeptidase [Gammaproteobacteria bacterium]|nr:prolyl aminopeptidase [Gammaproteobacteria bacterium]
METLYPAIKPYVTHSIPVEGPHILHVEECGNPEGVPVLFVHGGPGAGCEPWHRRFFDPEAWRIILFDQRGAGRSRPHAELSGNTTQALVDDMDVIRQQLGVKQWVLFGGSWGATLSLVYAETYPENVLGMILRGIFLCRAKEIDWFYQYGASRIYPDLWEDFISLIPESEQDDLLAAYYKRLTGEDEVQRMAAAKAWAIWEGRTANLKPKKSVVEHFSDPFTALSLARIEAHYFMNNAFLKNNQILRNADKLNAIPGTIVQGRYDMICPMESAWELYQTWTMAELHIISDAGHSASEVGLVDALVKANRKMLKKLS